MKNFLSFKKLILFFFFFSATATEKVLAKNFENGKEFFQHNCVGCHENGKNLIIPEKNLKKETLEANGMNNSFSILYQIRNGKNGMPAFGERLNEFEMEQITSYVLENEFSSF